MSTVTFVAKYAKNSGLVLSPKELRDIYLFGINFSDQNGVYIDDNTYSHYIKASTEQVERDLNLLFKKQFFKESFEFNHDEWRHWGFIKTTYPVVCAQSLEGFLNTTKQVTYPKQWLSSKKSSDGVLYHRQLYIVPAGDSTIATQTNLFVGIVPNLGYLNQQIIPNYWTVSYVTGFDRIPMDIVDVIGKLAAINLLVLSGNIILGSGITSASLSIDGLSQSLSTGASMYGPYSGTINGYLKMLPDQIKRIRDYYRGLVFNVA